MPYPSPIPTNPPQGPQMPQSPFGSGLPPGPQSMPGFGDYQQAYQMGAGGGPPAGEPPPTYVEPPEPMTGGPEAFSRWQQEVQRARQNHARAYGDWQRRQQQQMASYQRQQASGQANQQAALAALGNREQAAQPGIDRENQRQDALMQDALGWMLEQQNWGRDRQRSDQSYQEWLRESQRPDRSGGGSMTSYRP